MTQRSSPLSSLRSAVAHLRRIAEIVTVCLFIGMFLLFVVAVAQRYLLTRPANWIDESILVLFLWTTFLTEALVLTDREQVTFDVIWDVAGPGLRRAIGLLAASIVAVIFGLAAPTIIDYVTFLWRERTSALQWRLDWVYSCFIIYWVAVIVRAVDKLLRLGSSDWKAQVQNVATDEKTNVLG